MGRAVQKQSHAGLQAVRSMPLDIWRSGKGGPRRRLFTDEQVLEIRRSDATLKELADQFGCHRRTIHQARTRLSYKKVGGFDAAAHAEAARKRSATAYRHRDYEKWKASIANNPGRPRTRGTP